MALEKTIAGVFAGSAALLLIYLGHITEGTVIAATMLGFFVGDMNGQRKAVAA